jgi:hypothetical protein
VVADGVVSPSGQMRRGGIRRVTSGGTGAVQPCVMAEEPVLFGWQVETTTIDVLLSAAATGTSGALVLLGEAGIRRPRCSTTPPDDRAPCGCCAQRGRTGGRPAVRRPAPPAVAGAGLSIGPLPCSQVAAISTALELGPGDGDRFLVGAGCSRCLRGVRDQRRPVPGGQRPLAGPGVRRRARLRSPAARGGSRCPAAVRDEAVRD